MLVCSAPLSAVLVVSTTALRVIFHDSLCLSFADSIFSVTGSATLILTLHARGCNTRDRDCRLLLAVRRESIRWGAWASLWERWRAVFEVWSLHFLYRAWWAIDSEIEVVAQSSVVSQKQKKKNLLFMQRSKIRDRDAGPVDMTDLGIPSTNTHGYIRQIT